ncbi:WD40/YVTN repeat-like-containing domain [Lasallia pustulata]|uniref:WD40/YVTN repeat-like-containing domain n=1 Tax=Lasallia pustulata TaxID=136370 RepID=A0A1W5CW70_9LECA|nr:WD40/YVTN repeat-like-containing domain [Lasallia pustulata]
MKIDFKFSNLLGTVYCKGNLLFTPDGTCLLSPVGNRVTVFDLINNKSHTLPFSHRRNISRIALTPQGNLLLSVDEDGRAVLTNLPRQLALYYFSFKGPVTALAFSPSGRHFAVGTGRHVEVWRTPSTPDSGADGELEFAPFVRHRVHAGHHDTVQSVEWSGDSRFFLSAAKDLTARIWSLDSEEGFVPTTLAGHRERVLGAWFSSDQESIYTISQDGALFRWAYVAKAGHVDDGDVPEGQDLSLRWRIVQRHYFLQNDAKVKCAAFHSSSNLLVAGFSNGLFGLYEMPEFNMIHTLSISQNGIDFVAMNKTGEWLAFGASKLGQLLVWEWQSESYILKQQGHYDSMNALVYSPDGQRIITTADDGKIKKFQNVHVSYKDTILQTQTSEPLQVQADVLDVAFRPDSKQIAVSTLDGQLTFWSVSDASQQAGVDGRRDVSGGRKLTDRRTAANAAGTKAFGAIKYSADGTCILAGGTSKYICLYDVQSGTLLKKFTVSVNLSLDGTQEFLNSRNLTEAGPAGLIDDQGEASDLEDRIDRALPGSSRGDLSRRKTRSEVRVTAVGFSPTGRAFCAASTEGLLIYSLDHALQFDPFDLDITITTASTLKVLAERDYLRALVMAFRLNERNLIRRVYEAIPVADISLVVKSLPTVYLALLLRFVAQAADETPHLEFNLLWLEASLSAHGRYLKDNSGSFPAEMRTVQRAVSRIQSDLARMADDNIYALDYLLSQPIVTPKRDLMEEVKALADGQEESVDVEEEWMGLEYDGENST